MRRRHVFPRFALVVVIAALFALPGCAKKPAGAGAAVGSSGQPPSDEEARQFAKTFEANVKAGNLAAVNAAIDWDAIINRALADIDAPDAIKKSFSAGVKKAIYGKAGITAVIVNKVKQGEEYRLLRLHRQDGQQRALFRLHCPTGGLNYHDLVLVRQADGRVRADDMYIFATGEMFSQTFRRGFLPVAAEASRSMLDKLTQQESDYLKNLDQILSFSRHVRDGEGAQAMAIYDRFPDSLKRDKNLLITRLAAARLLGHEQQDAAVRAFRSACPHDPALDLLLIDSYYLHKQYAKERTSIDRLDRAVGGDPQLDILRASSFLAEGDRKGAKECFRKAVAADDSLISPYFNLIAISVHEQDFDETSRLLTLIREKFPRRLPNVTRIPLYAEYVKSPQGQAWLEALKKDR